MTHPPHRHRFLAFIEICDPPPKASARTNASWAPNASHAALHAVRQAIATASPDALASMSGADGVTFAQFLSLIDLGSATETIAGPLRPYMPNHVNSGTFDTATTIFVAFSALDARERPEVRLRSHPITALPHLHRCVFTAKTPQEEVRRHLGQALETTCRATWMDNSSLPTVHIARSIGRATGLSFGEGASPTVATILTNMLVGRPQWNLRDGTVITFNKIKWRDGFTINLQLAGITN